MNRIVITMLIALSFKNLSAQEPEYNLGFDIRPQSPEVASLGKFGAVPIGHFTGIPSVDIPLYTVTGSKLSVPISVSYHAGGIKVEEIASMAGLGWSLVAGGAVTRQVRGIPDDSPTIGFLYSSYKPSDFESDIGTLESVTRMEEVMNRMLDLETDAYSFSVQGVSGEFFFDENGDHHLKSQQDVKIEIVRVSEGEILGWIITAPTGTKYYFGKSKDGNRNARDQQTSKTLSQNRVEPLPTGTTAWHLLDIVDANETDHIKLFYKSFVSQTCTYASETQIWFISGPETCEQPRYTPLHFSESIGSLYLLDSIHSVNSSVKFSKENYRQDFSGSKSLDNVLIYNKAGELLKTFHFQYSYFVSNDSPLSTPCSMLTSDEQLKRLKLETIQEFDGQSNSLPPYRFFYNTTNLPGRFSKSVDYWGYFNGKENSTLIPAMEVSFGAVLTFLEGADRVPHINFSKSSTLTKIEYPTSGSVEFEFEQNRVNQTGGQKLLGILEPKSLVIVDNNAIQTSDTLVIDNHDDTYAWINYEYLTIPDCDPSTKDCELSFKIIGIGNSFNMEYTEFSGQIMLNNGTYRVTVKKTLEDFNYDQFIMDWKESTQENGGQAWAGGLRVSKMITRDGQGNPPIVTKYEYENGSLTASPIMGWKESMLECGSCIDLVRASVSSYPLSTARGGYAGYRNVKEIYGENGENGYTKMEFDFNYDNDIEAMEFPFPPPDVFNSVRGDLLIKEYYSSTNERVKREQYFYESAFGQSSIHFNDVKCYKVSRQTNGACFADYPTTGFWRFLKSKVTKTYNGSNFISDSVIYEYDHPASYVQHNREISYASDGSVRELIKKYPLDANGEFTFTFNTPQLNAKNEMVERFMIDQPLEAIFSKANIPVKKIRRDFVLEGNNVLPSRTFLAADGTNYVEEIKFEEYDLSGNILQLTRKTSPPESYIWSSDGTELLAAVVNASEDQVFYTSFEEDGISGAAKTGIRYYAGATYTIPLEDRPEGTNLLMTYWYYDGSWKLQSEATYTPTITIPGATRYDEVRVYPKGAQMTSYTYKPGIGISTVNDPNNIIIYYEYDSFSRLSIVRNDRGNILNHYSYNYKN